MGVTINPFTGEPQLINAGGGGGADANAFAIVQPPAGTSPTASSVSDTLNLTSADSSVIITGTAASKSLDFKVSASATSNKVSKAGDTMTGSLGITNTAGTATSIVTGDPATKGLVVKGTLNSSHDANLYFYAGYPSSIDANYSNSTAVTGTYTAGTPTVSGGKLNLTGTSNQGVYYDISGGATTVAGAMNNGKITIGMDYTPSYTGFPANPNNKAIFTISNATQNGSTIRLTYFYDGYFRLYGQNASGGTNIGGPAFGTWSPTAGTTYRIELDVDVVTGATRLFINGTQLGSTVATTMAFGSAAKYLYLGYEPYFAASPADAYISNVYVYNGNWHTANYTVDPNYNFVGTPQSGDLQQWQDSTGTNLAKVDANGNITAPSVTVGTTELGALGSSVAGNTSSIATLNTASALNTAALKPSATSLLFDDFDLNGPRLSWAATSTGTGAGSATPPVFDGQHLGVWRLTPGTTATGIIARYAHASMQSVGFGFGSVSWESQFSFVNLSVAAEEYVFAAGFHNALTTGGAPTNGIYFTYDRATTGNYWVVKSVSASTVTTVVLDGTSGNPTCPVTAATYTKLGLIVNAAGTSVTAYVNGTAVCTITTNIPTGTSKATGEGFYQKRTAYTAAAVYVDIDYWYRLLTLTTAR